MSKGAVIAGVLGASVAALGMLWLFGRALKRSGWTPQHGFPSPVVPLVGSPPASPAAEPSCVCFTSPCDCEAMMRYGWDAGAPPYWP